MGNKPLLTESKLSWIRDTTAEAPAKADRRDDSSREEEAKAPKEPVRSAPEPVKQTLQDNPPAYRGVGQGPISRTSEQPDKAEAPLSGRRTTGQQAPGQAHMRQAQPPGMRQEGLYEDGAENEPLSARPKRPGMVHYWLALVALICVAVTVPERYGALIFLGFIFVILIEISYRVGQHYYQARTNAEALRRILQSLRQGEKCDRQGPR